MSEYPFVTYHTVEARCKMCSATVVLIRDVEVPASGQPPIGDIYFCPAYPRRFEDTKPSGWRVLDGEPICPAHEILVDEKKGK